MHTPKEDDRPTFSTRPAGLVRASNLVHGLFLACITLWATACASPPAPESTSEAHTIGPGADLSFLTLGPGDRIAVALHGQQDVRTPPDGSAITAAGNLILPVVGPVHIAGLTEEEALRKLTEEFARFYREPRLSFTVMERSSKRFFVLGAVSHPGPKTMDRALTALEALSFGDGLAPTANHERIALIRRHEDGVEVHLFSAETPDAEGLVQILPDDLLFVARSGAGRFQEQVVPYLQGVGFTTSQIASLIIVADRL